MYILSIPAPLAFHFETKRPRSLVPRIRGGAVIGGWMTSPQQTRFHYSFALVVGLRRGGTDDQRG